MATKQSNRYAIRPADSVTYPAGCEALAPQVEAIRQKLATYATPGIPPAVLHYIHMIHGIPVLATTPTISATYLSLIDFIGHVTLLPQTLCITVRADLRYTYKSAQIFSYSNENQRADIYLYSKGSTVRFMQYGLAHELAHAEDLAQGTMHLRNNKQAEEYAHARCKIFLHAWHDYRKQAGIISEYA